MNKTLHHDLARWEVGDLSLEELERLHPDADIAGPVSVHVRLTQAAASPAPDPAAAWAALAARLPGQAAQGRARRYRRQIFVAIVAVILGGPAISYAAAPEAIRDFAHEVADRFSDRHGNADGNDPGDADPHDADTTADAQPDAPATTQPTTAVEVVDPDDDVVPGSSVDDIEADDTDTVDSPAVASSDAGDSVPDLDDPEPSGASPSESVGVDTEEVDAD